jgi:hypothetical protein
VPQTAATQAAGLTTLLSDSGRGNIRVRLSYFDSSTVINICT